MNQDLVNKVWAKGKPAEDDDHKYESVTDGIKPAKMYRYSRKNTNMAWEVDHIFPKKILEELGVPEELINHIDNLRPLQHSNNEAKGDLFPSYNKSVCWDSERQMNASYKRNVAITEDTISKLQTLFAPYLNGKTLEQVAKEYNSRH